MAYETTLAVIAFGALFWKGYVRRERGLKKERLYYH